MRAFVRDGLLGPSNSLSRVHTLFFPTSTPCILDVFCTDDRASVLLVQLSILWRKGMSGSNRFYVALQ